MGRGAGEKYIAMPAISALLFYLCASAFVSAGSCETGVEAKPLTLSLKDAISIACKNNKEIQIMEQGIEIAKSGILYAQSGVLPKLNAGYGYTYNGAQFKLPQAFVQAEGVHKDIGIFTGYQNDNLATISVDETIFDGGATYANIKQARLNLKAAREELRARKLEVEFETKRLFHGLLLAYEIERINRELVEQARAHYSDVSNMFDQGTASRFDLLQSKVQISKVTPAYIRAGTEVDIVKAELKKLLSIDIRNEVEVSGKLTYIPIPIDETGFLIAAYLGNPRVIAQTLGIDISKWAIDTAQATLMPQVSGSFGYNFRSSNPATIFTYKHINWSGGVTVTVPLFDGFSTTAKVHEARAKYAQAILSTANLRDQIAVDVRRGCLDLVRAGAVIDSQKDSITEAAEALRISIVSYENGEAINLDILDSQVSLSEVERNLAAGIYDYLMAQAFLDKTMGNEFLKD